MLKIMRRKDIMKKILWGLAIIIIPAFVLWGTGSLSKKRYPYKYVGTIGGKKITAEAFVKSLKDVRIGLFINYAGQPQVLNKVLGDRPLMNRLAWENLLINELARENRVAVTNEEVVNFVTRHPLFARGGSFDGKVYDYILKNSLGMTPRAFEEGVRNFLVNAKFKASVVKNIDAGDKEVKDAYRKEVEKASFFYVQIDGKDFLDKAKVPNEDISRYYAKHKQLFAEPEKVILEYVAFPHREENSREKAMADLKVAYGQFKKRPSEIANTARLLGLDLKETAPFARDEIVPEITDVRGLERVAFGIKPRTEVITLIDEDERGTSYVIRVKERRKPRVKKENEVRDYILNVLKNKKAAGLAKERADEFYKDAVSGNLTLEQIARKHNLPLGETKLISRFDYIEGVGESYSAVDEDFRLKPNEISPPLPARNGYVIIQPMRFEFMSEKEFEKVESDYRAKIISLKKLKALEGWMDTLKKNSSLEVDLGKI